MNAYKVFSAFIVLIAILTLATSSVVALERDDGPAAYRLITAEPENTNSTTDFSQPDYLGCGDAGCGTAAYCCPRWTATADFIVFDREGTKTQTLIESIATESEVLNSNDFHQGFYGGPRVSLIRHGDRCYDLELLYFQVDGWHSSRSFTPEQDILVFSAPDYTVSTTFDPMQFDYSSKLYNAEFNVRWNPTCRVTMLAGFRWVNLRENLNGGLTAPTFESFWNTHTNNELYGFQIGTDTILWQRNCFSIDGLLKAGVYGNHADQTTTAVIDRSPVTVSGATNHVSFLGELGLQAKYQVNRNLILRAGYEVLWLDGVALAPGQIPETFVQEGLAGIDTKAGVLYHVRHGGF